MRKHVLQENNCKMVIPWWAFTDCFKTKKMGCFQSK